MDHSWQGIRRVWAGMALAAALSVPAVWAANFSVDIVNFAFSPPALTINVGDTVTWTQKDAIAHTTTSGTAGTPDGVWESGFMTLAANTTFSHTFNNAGTFPYFCRPHNFMTGTITVEAAANVPPTVNLTNPANGAAFQAPASVTLQASASDSDGTVASVKFNSGATLLAVVTNSPYTFTWSNVPAGTYTMTAEAQDNLGATTVSAPVNITVTNPASPIRIASNNADPSNVTLSWTGGVGPYLVQRKPNLSAAAWENVKAVAGQTTQVAAPQRADFWRIADLAQAMMVPFTASLSGAAVRPNPVTTPGGGFGSLSLDGNTLSFSIAYTNLSGTATRAHIHGPASAAESAGVMIDLAPFNGGAFGVAGTFSGAVVLSEDQKALILTSRTYVNVHTPANPSGEIRGQIVPVLMRASLNGAAQRPNPVTTSGSGSGLLLLVGNRLTFNLTYAGLSGAATLSHIHGPATTEESAGVLIDLAPFNGGAFGTAGRLEGSVALSPDQLAYLVDGNTYVNIHTGANPSGEIRGQITAQTTAVPMTASLSGDAVRPNPVTSAGSASAVLSLEGDTLSFNLGYRNLSGPATLAHIHGPATTTESAGVMINLAPFNGGAFGASGTLSGSVTLTADQRVLLLNGLTYVNIHTANNPSGEIRGQIVPVLRKTFLSGAAARPNPVETSSKGFGLMMLVKDQLTFDVTYGGLSGTASLSHIHGPASLDESAGVLINLAPFNGGAFGISGSLAGTVGLTPDQLGYLIDGRTYVNIHTGANPSGEIRGQITP